MDCGAGEHRKIICESSFLICLPRSDARNHRRFLYCNMNIATAPDVATIDTETVFGDTVLPSLGDFVALGEAGVQGNLACAITLLSLGV